MATKSILKNVNITNKRLGRSFVNALDSSKAAKGRDFSLKHSCKEITGKDIKKFFDN